ncbi:hypothetical protein RJT34_05423 [Clitoria ternatea]|uniref:DUF7650 domain-containing protein n=1 Tax=Clitoria ternatea TaxID=43366 RepID=A0AAN9PT01_CLITE
MVSFFESFSKINEKDQLQGKYLLPGLLDDQSWTDIEYNIFLLGLCISRSVGEEKIPFEEYIFSLKDAASIELLITVVGIGKGKQDLTGIAVEPTKTSHIFPARPEIPIGKACSSLTSADIIKFLTGDFRLGKVRSSDLFWEAV